MLAPSSRLTLIDGLRPPPGHTFDGAMAVTFTLDLQALLAAPAAFALAQETDQGIDGVEPIELLHAIRSHADDITVFVQAGQIALPPSRRIFSFLERSVVPVTAPLGGIVHPKVWVVRYVDPDGVNRHRVLIASRNLTFDTSWDTVVRLDESAEGLGADLSGLGVLFETMLARAVTSVDGGHLARVRSLCAALGTARFAIPAGVDDLRLHLFGVDKEDRWPFPSTFTRSLVVSPFLGDEFFARLGPIDQLVSRPESIDALTSSTLGGIERLSVFDDGAGDEATPGVPADDPGRPRRGLHAKVYAFETGDRAQLFCGSANASGVAFGTNVEVLLELTGSIDRLGIDALTGGTDDEIGLSQLFQPYQPADDPEPEDRDLDSLRIELGTARFTGEVNGADEQWHVRYRSAAPIEIPDGVAAVCWPLSVAGNRKDIVTGVPLDLSFDVSIEAITRFLAIEIHRPADDQRTSFVVPVDLQGVPDERDRRLMRLLVGNAERFLRYLLALLGDQHSDGSLIDLVDDVTGSADGDSAADLSSMPVLEVLLRSLRSEPERLTGLDPLVRDLSGDGALPPGFEPLWRALVDTAGIRKGRQPR